MERSITFDQLYRLSNEFADALRHRGIGRGDRIVIALANSPEFMATLFGSIKLGTTVALVSSLSTPEELRASIAQMRPRVAVLHSSCNDGLRDCVRGDEVELFVVAEPDQYGKAAEWSNGARHESAFTKSDADSSKIVLFTSGTTGRRKAVVHSYSSLAKAARNVGEKVFNFNAQDRVMCLSGWHSAFGLGFGVCFPMFVGATTICHENLVDIDGALAKCCAFHPTVIIGVPTSLAGLLRAGRRNADDRFKHLRYVVSAGEPLSHSVFDVFKGRYGVDVLDGMGTTETLTHFLTNVPGRPRRDSCGKCIDGCEVQLRDDEGRCLQNDEIGALFVRSETTFAEYFGNPEQTSHALVDGWLRTGDLMRRDRDGYFKFCGRADDMLKISGMWVSSREVEEALNSHPSIRESIVTVRPDACGRSRLVAYVRPTSDQSLSAVAMVAYLNRFLPPRMIPSALVNVSEFPLTPMGKINRSALPSPWA